jgi:hypothetical protein
VKRKKEKKLSRQKKSRPSLFNRAVKRRNQMVCLFVVAEFMIFFVQLISKHNKRPFVALRAIAAAARNLAI